MLDDRKTAILRAVVQEYIATAQPVGSTHIADAPGVRVSSATVRNEMAVLEQEGYLAQPHTSAGRIPTDKGYRFFVDHMATPGRLEEMLHRTSDLLARLTNYAAVVVGPKAEAALRTESGVLSSISTISFSTVPLPSTSTTVAAVEDRATSWTERTVAASGDGATTTAA